MTDLSNVRQRIEQSTQRLESASSKWSQASQQRQSYQQRMEQRADEIYKEIVQAQGKAQSVLEHINTLMSKFEQFRNESQQVMHDSPQTTEAQTEIISVSRDLAFALRDTVDTVNEQLGTYQDTERSYASSGSSGSQRSGQQRT